MKSNHKMNLGCLAITVPSVISLINIFTVISIISRASYANYLVLVSFITFILVFLSAGGIMIWSIFQSKKGLFLSILVSSILSIISMIFLAVFLVVFTVFTYNPVEAAENKSVIERVWSKTPVYKYLKGFEVALNVVYSVKTSDENSFKESNNQLEKLLIENLDLETISARKRQKLFYNMVKTEDAVEMLRIIQLLSIKANYNEYLSCNKEKCSISMVTKRDLKNITDNPDGLIEELKAQNYLNDIGINESFKPDGNVFILMDSFKALSDPSQMQLSNTFQEDKRIIYSILKKIAKNNTFFFHPKKDFFDYNDVENDGFKAILLNYSDKLVVHFWGTEFLSPDDPVANFRLGRDPQWNNHREEILNKVRDYVSKNPQKPIYYIGYSLGGGLAQYAAYETARLDQGDIGQIYVFTFCGIGVMDEINNLVDSNGNALGKYKQYLADDLVMMHFTTMGDIVSLMGGGHLQGKNTHMILLGDPKDESFFIRAHFIENLLTFIDEEGAVFKKTFEFPRNWYLETRAIQSDTGQILSFLLNTGKTKDEEVWFRIFMSVSLTLGKSGIDQESRTELEELRKWLIHNAITAGREDLYNVLTRIDWQRLRERAKLAVDEKQADKLALHIYLEVLNGNEKQVKEFQRLNARILNIAKQFKTKPVSSAKELSFIAQEYLSLLIRTGIE